MVFNSKNILYTLCTHAVLWFCLLVLPVLTVAPFVLSDDHAYSQMFYLMYGYSSAILLFIFYTNYLFLLPKYFFNNKKNIYFLGVILMILLVALITRLIIACLSDFNAIHSKQNSIYIAFGVFRILLALFFSGALLVYENWQKSERERLVAEISFLKSQINPHFLFNTLNGIYTLVLKKSDRAAESVSKLSALMQYVTTDATKEKVLLEDEINYIANYIELQKLRLTNTTRVKFSVEGNPSSLKIEPLLLITFIENAFKHGVSTERESEIQIAMTIIEGELRLFISNTISQNKAKQKNDPGVGLVNTLNRLKKRYPNLHTLNIDQENESYTVNLYLQLK